MPRGVAEGDRMDYDELTIEIASRTGGGYGARVLASPTGETPQAAVDLPFSQEELARVAPALEQRVRAAAGTWRSEGAAPEPPPGPVPVLPSYEELGDRLFRALFAADVGDLFERLLRDAADRSREAGARRGLRLRLRFRGDDDQAAMLMSLPWELLWSKATRGYLARDVDTPIVRDIEPAGPVGERGVLAPLKVLVVAPSPVNWHPVSVTEELGRIRRGLRRVVRRFRERVELRRLDRPTFDGLCEKLRREPYHVVHFAGHAGFLANGEAALLFENDRGGEELVHAAVVADGLKTPHFDHLRLVVLNSCDTAAVPRTAGADPMTATAQRLLLRGVPAVVAMQFPVSNTAAPAFAEALYGALARYARLETATTEARLAMAKRSDEWFTPVVYLHSRDGRLLEPRACGLAAPAAAPSREASGPGGPAAGNGEVRAVREEGLRLGFFSDPSRRRQLSRDNDRVLSLARWVPRRPDAGAAIWDPRMLPALADFLEQALVEPRPVRLDFATHPGVAFAAGWLLRSRRGGDLVVRERRPEGEVAGESAREFAPVPEEPLWLPEAESILMPGAPDVAVAVSATRPILAGVERFVERRGLAVSRILPASVAPRPAAGAVAGGAHARALAERLARRVRGLAAAPGSTLYLFAAAPEDLMFHLGQYALGLGPTAVFVDDPGSAGGFRLALRLPPPGAGDAEPS